MLCFSKSLLLWHEGEYIFFWWVTNYFKQISSLVLHLISLPSRRIIEILKFCHVLVNVLSLVCNELNRNALLITTLPLLVWSGSCQSECLVCWCQALGSSRAAKSTELGRTVSWRCQRPTDGWCRVAGMLLGGTGAKNSLLRPSLGFEAVIGCGPGPSPSPWTEEICWTGANALTGGDVLNEWNCCGPAMLPASEAQRPSRKISQAA